MHNKPSSTPALVWGIVSLLLSWVPVLGIVFSAIGLKAAKKFLKINGEYDKKSKAGRILSIIALILSILFTVAEIAMLAFGVFAYLKMLE